MLSVVQVRRCDNNITLSPQYPHGDTDAALQTGQLSNHIAISISQGLTITQICVFSRIRHLQQGPTPIIKYSFNIFIFIYLLGSFDLDLKPQDYIACTNIVCFTWS